MSYLEVLTRMTIRSRKLEELTKTRFVFVALLALVLGAPAFGVGSTTYKTTYPVPCGEVWAAVKVALSNPDNYKDVQSDIGTTCEMSVVSMYSGLSHNDQGDFKKRVDEALAKMKNVPPSQPAKLEDRVEKPAK